LTSPTLPYNVSMITSWLQDVPKDLRQARGARLYELGDEVVYAQLTDESAAALLRRTVEFVSDLAQEHLDGCGGAAFARAILEEPRLVELGLLIVSAQLSRTAWMPRDQGFYPAILLERDVLSVIKHTSERDQPAVSLVWKLVSLREPALVQQIEDSAVAVERGFAEGARWPDGEEAARLRSAIAAARSVWESLAGALLFAVQSQGGKLPMEAVEAAASPAGMLRAERVLLVDSINRSRQRQDVHDLIRGAMAWPIRADGVLGNLEGELGWLRLYIAYLQAIWSGVLRAAQTCGHDAGALVERCGEVIERDLAYPIAAGVEPLEDVVTLFREASSYDQTRKKRLSRQRERCLRGALDVVESDWVDLLRDIAAGYLGEGVL